MAGGLRRRKPLGAVGRKAVRRLERLAREAGDGEGLTDWERSFVEGEESPLERVKRYGRAFANPELGDVRRPLSIRQGAAVGRLEAKLRGRTGTGPDPRPLGSNEDEQEGETGECAHSRSR